MSDCGFYKSRWLLADQNFRFIAQEMKKLYVKYTFPRNYFRKKISICTNVSKFGHIMKNNVAFDRFLEKDFTIQSLVIWSVAENYFDSDE